MKNLIALLSSICSLGLIAFSSTVFAQAKPNVSYSMPAVEFGFKWNSADYDSNVVAPGVTNKQEIGFQLGASAVFDFAPSFGLKTGLFYSERPITTELAGVTTKSKASYFEVPAFFMFKFEEYAGIYAGPSLAIKMADENLISAKSMIIPITFGAQFKFLPNVGANIFFETVPSEIATGIKSSRAVGASLLITLD